MSVYESAYTYCPNSATIVASRFNIEFHPAFFEKVAQNIEEKFHYYMLGFLNKKNQMTTFEGFEEKNLRIKANYFKSHFQHVQIFKSDLLKQQYMQILKCGEVEFY